jgi:hypothetical protein
MEGINSQQSIGDSPQKPPPTQAPFVFPPIGEKYRRGVITSD